MKPEEIQGRDFLVGLRGYDKDEVREFLSEIAAEHAAIQAELEELRRAPVAIATAEPRDDFENLGASVAAILRTAKESAAEITSGADAAAMQVREEAERYAETLRQQAEETRAYAAEAAEEVRRQATAEIEQLRTEAQTTLVEARAEAERLVREATERVRQLEVEAEARIRNQTEAMLREHEERAAEAQRRESSLRARLQEAADEVSLALLALGDPTAAPAEAAVDLVVEEGTVAEESQDHAWS